MRRGVGPGGTAPLELENSKNLIFLIIRAPLDKICSVAPANEVIVYPHIHRIVFPFSIVDIVFYM